MASPPILTALNVPTVTSYPSINCLQWSPDGQLCFSSKTAAYIMTPDHGINFDNSSVIRSSLSRDNHEDHLALGWFRTIIQFDKSLAFRWPECSQEWGAASLGSIDVTLWAATFSPSSLSPEAGCILAALGSNMDLTLWTATKNCLKGEWNKILDLTPFLIEAYAPPNSTGATTAQTLKAQVVSITWTAQTDFGISPTPALNGSLLIAGNRAGSLIFLRYKSDNSIEHVHTISVADKWITQVAFAQWSLVQSGTCTGYVAYGTSDGAVGLVKVTQTLQETPSVYPFGPEFTVSAKFEHSSDMISQPDKTGISALRWVSAFGKKQILVYCKPGIVHLWSFPSSSETGWSSSRSLPIKTQKISIASAPFHPVSGINYVQKSDKLLVTLFDGSFHVVHNLTHDPSWPPRKDDTAMDVGEDTPETHDDSAREAVSKVAREVFVKTEAGDVDNEDVNRITGALGYDGGEVYVWIQEASRPADFSYKHDARHNSTLVVAQMWEDSNDEGLLKDLSTLLQTAKAGSGFAPLHLLRPYLVHLRNPQKLNALLPRVLGILQPNLESDHSISIRFPKWEGGLNLELRQEFRKSLARHLFGWDVMLSLRIRLSLADFAWKLSDGEEKREQCGNVAQILLNTISHRVLRTIIRHLVAVVGVLTPSDVAFVLRMVVQSLLPGSPPDLSQEGHHLSSIVQTLIPRDSESNSISNELNEVCPACHVEVALQDITTAVCPNGHTWARCSITTFILSTPFVRSCVGCSRKAFLPLSAPNSAMAQTMLPAVARGWVVEELLEAVHRYGTSAVVDERLELYIGRWAQAPTQVDVPLLPRVGLHELGAPAVS